MTTTKYWYALYANSNQQLKIRDRLLAHGMEAYVPCKKVERSHARKVELKDVPIIPTYVFFICDTNELPLVRQVQGVSRIVRTFLHTGDYVRIPDEQVQNIREACTRADGELTFSEGGVPFRNGTKVRVTGGMFKGIVGEVAQIDESKPLSSLFLRIENLACAKVEIETKYIQLAEE